MPALNEADALPAALDGRPSAVRVLVVDNGSTDGTARVARALGADVICEPRRGFGAACRAGFLASEPGDIVVFMDADATLDWADLDAVVQPLQDGAADLVLGRRVRSRREVGSMSWHVAWANVLLGLLCRLVAGVRIHDISPFRAIRRETLQRLALRDSTYGWPLEMVLRAGRAGLRIVEVPVAYRVRAGRSKVTGRPWPTAKTAARMAWVAVTVTIPHPSHSSRTQDVVAVLGLVAATVAVAAPFLTGGVVLGLDAATQFIPWYTWLGEHLRVGDIPVWNPHVFAGTPGIGEPLSGWGYILAMVPFTLLPAQAAVPVFVIATLAVAGVGTYFLARALGLTLAPALVAAVVGQYAGLLFVNSWCCFAYPAVAAWLPWALLGVERWVAASDRAGRTRAVALSAFALTQILTGWFGQGFFYAVVVVGTWSAVRCLSRRTTWPSRIALLAGLGFALLVVTAGLAAVFVIPRVEFNTASNLAGGYPVGERVGGWTLRDVGLLVTPGRWHVGASVLLLAACAGLMRKRRWLVAGLAGGCAAVVVLALARVTPLHTILEAIPVAGRLHPHAPQRVLVVLPVLVGLLAAFGLSAAVDRLSGRARIAASMVAVVVVAAELIGQGAFAVHRYGLEPSAHVHLERVDVARAYDPMPLPGVLTSGGGRHFVYDPLVEDGQAKTRAYTARWHHPSLRGVPVINAAIWQGLYDIQGYSATHIDRYDALIRAINGTEQEYHFADIRPDGLRSPLLDLLDVRRVIVPAAPQPEQPTGIRSFSRGLTAVSTTGAFRVLERPSPLGPAWLVHEAQQVVPGAALAAIAAPGFDPAARVVVEQQPPPLAVPADPARDVVTIVRRDGDVITYDTNSGAAAVLVMSEVWYPGWTATVDGEPAELQPVNHALRGIALTAGQHTVTVHAPHRSLAVGGAISGMTVLLLLVACRRRRH